MSKTDWRWCQENPIDAAALIDDLNERLSLLKQNKSRTIDEMIEKATDDFKKKIREAQTEMENEILARRRGNKI